MKIVIVESPAKARSLSQYFGDEYKVFASYGHIRELPAKQGSVRPEENFAFTWKVTEKAQKPLKEIEKALKNADTLILATDLDREGEAISWHLFQYLCAEKAITKDMKVQRISFHSVTKEAVLDALSHPREIDQQLVEAYLARLSLDYLFGFTLSPILWRKLPGSKSAGRVQSVALRMIVKREEEIEAFKTQEFWTIEGEFLKDKNFLARLSHLNGKKLDKFAFSSEESAKEIVEKLADQPFFVKEVETKRTKRNPVAPFITSTLQQEASRKLGFSPLRTMRIAQKLYEGIEFKGEFSGLITYMRTDSTHVEPSVIKECREYINQRFGKEYLPANSIVYKTKTKNAQEAHEAIRPTCISRSPQEVKELLDNDHFRLYKLIWDRMVSSQMAQALFDQTSISLVTEKEQAIFRATGSILIFDGFLVLYQESLEDGDKESIQKFPRLIKGDKVETKRIWGDQHFTQPPARFSEASLIAQLKECGIGRPSTYAYILQILQERNYVRQEKKRLIPEERGRIVSLFLEYFFSRYVDYEFTSNLEEELDKVSTGEKAWKKVLEEFWGPFEQTIKSSEKLKIIEILEQLEAERFKNISKEKLLCQKCKSHSVTLRTGKYGPFVSCAAYPECNYAIPLDALGTDAPVSQEDAFGIDPEENVEIFKKKGPYGWYLQWGEGKKRIAIPQLFSHEHLTLEQALWLKSLPLTLGHHPDTQEPVSMGIGRFGPYIKYKNEFYSLRKVENLMEVSLEDALKVVAKGKRPRKTSKKTTDS